MALTLFWRPHGLSPGPPSSSVSGKPVRGPRHAPALSHVGGRRGEVLHAAVGRGPLMRRPQEGPGARQLLQSGHGDGSTWGAAGRGQGALPVLPPHGEGGHQVRPPSVGRGGRAGDEAVTVP